MTGRRHLRLVAYGDDRAPAPPPPRRWSRRDVDLYEQTLAALALRGWHPAVAAIEAEAIVRRRHRAEERRP